MQKISTLWPHLAPFWPYLAPFGQCSPCAHVFASCVRVRARIFTKIFVWVFYYHISLSFKFHTDPSFCCGDIFSDTRYFKVPIRQGGSNHIQPDVSYVRFSCDKDWVLSIIYPFTNCVPHTLFNKLFFSPLVFPRHESPKPNHRSYAIQIRDSFFPPGKRPGLSKEQV